MALHVTPCSAPSRAVVRVSPSRPCLAATYADLKAEARNAWTEAILMTRPQCCEYIPGKTALVSRNGAVSIISIIRRHFTCDSNRVRNELLAILFVGHISFLKTSCRQLRCLCTPVFFVDIRQCYLYATCCQVASNCQANAAGGSRYNGNF